MTKYTKAQIKANREKWIKALESGRYHQGTYYLKKKSGNKPVEYCCLGVACQLASAAGVIPRAAEKMDYGEKIFRFGRDRNEESFLPIEVQRWLGVDSCDITVAVVDSYSNKRTVSSLNDDGKSFKEIAQYLRKELL